jgi:hypothetical protein
MALPRIFAFRRRGRERGAFRGLALKWIPAAGCAIGLIFLFMALVSSHELVQAAHATKALGFAVVPYLAVKALQDIVAGGR